MPNILSNLLKMSLISGLFVFIAFCGFTICCLFLCFALRSIQVLSRYSLGNTNFLRKKSIFLPKCRKESIELIHIAKSGLEIFCEIKKHQKSTLQKIQYSKKLLKYTLKVLKRGLDNLKSCRKLSKVLIKYSLRQYFPIFLVRYRSFSNLIPTL